jgi:thymidylate synthase ThyX
MEVKVIADSVSQSGVRLTTLQLKYWRAIHAEVMTHRCMSRNASSSRAIPIDKMIEQVRTNPAGPAYWGTNKPGMQAGDEIVGIDEARERWLAAASSAAWQAERLQDLGLHKQVVNRVLEPFQFIHVVISATDWENFFNLRIHPDAQPEIRLLAEAIRDARDASTPRFKGLDRGDAINWHLPYLLDSEMLDLRNDPIKLARISASRCARVSYLKHDGQSPSIEDDLALYERLAGSAPIHASPLEHQAYPLTKREWKGANFRGWGQFRAMVEIELQNEFDV